MNSIVFLVAENLEYYGDEAKDSDIRDYAEFSKTYLLGHGYDKVDISFIVNYPFNDEQYELRQEVWEAFCSQ